MADMQEKLINRPKDIVEYEDIWVDIGKRLFSQFDLIILFLNCISACFSISAGVSLIPQDTIAPDFCDLGNAIGVYVQCPYIEGPEFMIILGVCVIYFSAFIIFKVFWTYEYLTNDLRYYISCDMVVNSIIHKLFVCFGILFTIGGGLTGIGYVIHNGSTDSLGLIFSFMGINLFTFTNMLRGRYRVLYEKEISELFPKPIYLKFPNATACNLNGICINHRDLFDEIIQAVICSGSGEDSYLSKYGSPAQLRQVMQTISLTTTVRKQ